MSTSKDDPSHHEMSFKRLMALETLDSDIFRSITPAWPPGNGDRAFGGHVYAQAAFAASKTVANGMFLHNVTGHFLLPGRVDTPFIYTVRRVRDGGSYSLRQVSVHQHADTPLPKLKTLSDGKTPCFVATISFKCSEKSTTKFVPIAHQSVSTLHLKKYHSVLEDKNPEDHPVAPGADQAWWDERHHSHHSAGRHPETLTLPGERFPGLDIRKVDMVAYNGVVGEGGDGKVAEWRQLQFYRILQDEGENTGDEDEEEERHLHISAHLYASDRNSLFGVQRAYGYQAREVAMASLSHMVVFHGGVERLQMVEKDANGASRSKWFVQEAWTSNSGENRACHESRLWDWETGEVVGTTVQDGMVRIMHHQDPRLEGDKGNVRRRRAQRTEMDDETRKEEKLKGKL